MKFKLENLMRLGMPITVANVLAVLSDFEEHSLHEIEREADLGQPEVSSAVSTISVYTTSRWEKAGVGKGRPQKYVTLPYGDYKRCIDDYFDKKFREFKSAEEARAELL